MKRPDDHGRATRSTARLAARSAPRPTVRATDATAATPPPLGDLTTAAFMRRHWQRRPLLIRQAVRADDAALAAITRDTLADLAARDDVESRLITAADRHGRWSLEHGPFDRLPRRRARPWTLLVQGVDMALPAARSLLDRFRFIPDARIDDLMCSHAVDGGGVGPHVDSYDVFLLQVRGRRRWSIAPPADRPLVPDQPVRLVAPFAPEASWELEPGDMLYLPPGWAHDGVAIGECITASIGFRAPSRAELLGAFHAYRLDEGLDDPDHVDPDPNPAPGKTRSARATPRTRDARRRERLRERYRDPVADATRAATLAHPARLPESMVATLADWIEQDRIGRDLIVDFIGRHLTEPKPHVWFDAPDDAARPSFLAGGRRNASSPGNHSDDGGTSGAPGVRLDGRTRLMYRADRVYVNGEADHVPARSRRLLQRLADQRHLTTAETARACQDPWLRATLERWWSNGWLADEDE